MFANQANSCIRQRLQEGKFTAHKVKREEGKLRCLQKFWWFSFCVL